MESKKKQVTEMFNNIAPSYDFLNHFLSLGIDVLWRKKAIRILTSHVYDERNRTISNLPSPIHLLDIATGTADFAIEALKLNPEKIIGVDISEKMLAVGKEKIKKLALQEKINLQIADSENLPFQNDCFHAVTVGFGVRNFENLEKGLSEIYRVLKNGGTAVILEFSKPSKFPVKQIYNFYFNSMLPLIGKTVSKHNVAYTYLPESVSRFPDGNDFLEVLKKNNFCDLQLFLLTFGIATIYVAKKK